MLCVIVDSENFIKKRADLIYASPQIVVICCSQRAVTNCRTRKQHTDSVVALWQKKKVKQATAQMYCCK